MHGFLTWMTFKKGIWIETQFAIIMSITTQGETDINNTPVTIILDVIAK